MNTMAKGTIAGLAGIALLLGGAGTFALWNDTLAPWTGDTVQTGALQFADDGVEGAWYDVTNGHEEIGDLAGVYMVPGDTFQFEGTVAFEAYGKNLDAELTIASLENADLPEGLTFALTDENDVALNLDDAIDPTDTNVQTVEFRATLKFNSGTSGKTSQKATVELNDLTFKLDQTLASP